MSRFITFLKFFIPSIIGIFMFLVPLNIDGETTVPVAFFANFIIDTLTIETITLLVVITIVISAVMSILYSWILKSGSGFLNDVFNTTNFWVILRAIGAVFAVLAYLGAGPEMIISGGTGSMILNDLLPTLFTVFIIAGFFLPLLLNYGLLEFVGTLFSKIMRPLFTLPGRSTVDNLASWVGDGTVGVILTSKQYEDGYYSKREASVIASTFSVVSITFTIVVLDLIGLMHMFGQFYLTIIVAGVAAALIMPRIPPLSRIEDTYYNEGSELEETVPSTHNPLTWGYEKAMVKAEKSPGLLSLIKEGLKTVFDTWFGVLPIVMAIGTLGTILAEYTPIFSWLGAPFVPLFELIGIPEAQAMSETLFIGFTDMFLPAILIENVQNDMTRFIVGAMSITQLIYLSEVGGVILGSKIPLGLGKLFMIFLIRTVITLPIVIVAAFIIF
ncbi:nucleoside recognition GATE domain-containing membrane protein YjiH [Jeotgalicoccus aerolatus]|uniref:Nucleoside recognition GATE domain-containing membrane protein YjiH n=1 Tax=Jeotgalicoccus aerolatus TaxID=709510 RepID=A0A1G9BN50_9STAP|nr:YjiH family protein [Jeotgalicoccus aerolatus]NMA81034.1 YjiH family protein [Jeotgalicoccus aerolatus]SDK40922.1 nucleoside recognition GATE domain-containing membrane protein YjiH [Jeotgalicoccus aerolatus]HJG33528.1 YjiH family protein [Jeotgalicoccus aerolatus]